MQAGACLPAERERPPRQHRGEAALNRPARRCTALAPALVNNTSRDACRPVPACLPSASGRRASTGRPRLGSQRPARCALHCGTRPCKQHSRAECQRPRHRRGVLNRPARAGLVGVSGRVAANRSMNVEGAYRESVGVSVGVSAGESVDESAHQHLRSSMPSHVSARPSAGTALARGARSRHGTRARTAAPCLASGKREARHSSGEQQLRRGRGRPLCPAVTQRRRAAKRGA